MRIAVYVTGLDAQQKLKELALLKYHLETISWSKVKIDEKGFKLTAFKQTEPTEHDELALFENHKKALEQ